MIKSFQEMKQELLKMKTTSKTSGLRIQYTKTTKLPHKNRLELLKIQDRDRSYQDETRMTISRGKVQLQVAQKMIL
jgi:hypothetical protein